MRSTAQELLASGQIDCFIGYEEGTRGRVRPAFVHSTEDTDLLVWNDRCSHNLTVYLHQFQQPPRRGEDPPRVGILVKPCDSRSLSVLLREKQVERERLYVLGVTCDGLADGGGPRSRCERCTGRTPIIADRIIGEQPAVSGSDDYSDVDRLEQMSARERLAFWLAEFDRCIRCYACRQACPACYCEECVAEQLDPPWMGISIDLTQKQFFHIMRAYHLAGRCSGCNACEEACPMDIPLSLLNRKIARDVEQLFHYTTGGDPEVPLPLGTFVKEESLPL
jgi:ferredoxin